jgi:hypothetical protein
LNYISESGKDSEFRSSIINHPVTGEFTTDRKVKGGRNTALALDWIGIPSSSRPARQWTESDQFYVIFVQTVLALA